MPTTEDDEDRREFLKICGTFAAVTSPAMTLLLSTSLTSTAIARSGAQDGVAAAAAIIQSSTMIHTARPRSPRPRKTRQGSIHQPAAVVGALAGVAARTRVAQRGPRSRIPERKAPDLEVAAVTRPPRGLAARMEMTRRKRMSAIEKDKSSAA